MADAMKIKGTEIVETARQYVGTKYHHQARLRFHGLDCIGLLVVTAQDLGIPIKDVTNYRRIPDGKSLIANLDAQLEKTDEMLPGYILVFWINKETRPQHIAIYTGDGIIHTHAGVGRVIETDLSKAWRDKIHSVYSFKEVV
jgi:cell wall-associated NlpC family hydrolase